MLYGHLKASCRYLGSQSNCCLFTQFFDPFLALISVENDTLNAVTFVIPSITFKQQPSKLFSKTNIEVPHSIQVIAANRLVISSPEPNAHR